MWEIRYLSDGYKETFETESEWDARINEIVDCGFYDADCEGNVCVIDDGDPYDDDLYDVSDVHCY